MYLFGLLGFKKFNEFGVKFYKGYINNLIDFGKKKIKILGLSFCFFLLVFLFLIIFIFCIF